MDFIYSRKRIKIPKINNRGNPKLPNFKNKSDFSARTIKRLKIIIITIIALFVAWNLTKEIEPIIEEQCKTKAKSIATQISNKQASIVMEKYKYEDLCTVVKDENNNVKMIKSNVMSVNEITSDVAIRIQSEIDKYEADDIYIRLGSFTGNKFLVGRGPKVYFKISSIGNVDTNLKSEFISAGINQTLHKVYLEVKCKITILTPFSQVNEEITNQILIAEAVILGDVPGSYYNFDGVKQDNIIDVVE